MAYKCPKCGIYKVDKKTDICVMCRLQMEEGIPIQKNTDIQKERKKRGKPISEKENKKQEKPTSERKKSEPKETDKDIVKDIKKDTVKDTNKDIVKDKITDRREKKRAAEVEKISTDRTEITPSNDYGKKAKKQSEHKAEFRSTNDTDRFYNEYFAKPNRSSSRSSVNAFDEYRQGTVKEEKNAATPRSQIGSPTVRGIVRNVTVQTDSGVFLIRWIRGMFTSHTFTFSGQYTTFQVFPDYETDTLSSGEGAGSQVCIYGSESGGYLSDYNVVEVWGTRNLSRVIVAHRIRNVSNNTVIRPRGRVLRTVQWLLPALIVFGICSINWDGIVSAIFSWVLSRVLPIVIIIIIVRYIWRSIFRR